jgi:bifunctional DNase/RNase
MKNGVIPIQVLGVIPTSRGCAIFVGNEQKTFIIYVETSVGSAIAMFMQGTPKERPLTHDMIGHVFKGLGVSVERVVINDLKEGTYFARLILKQENELGQKIIEIDARPSDCLALAIQAKAPIFVAKNVFDEVEDTSEVLKKLNEMQSEELSGLGGTAAGGGSSKANLDIDEPAPEEEDEDEPPESEKS